MDIDLIYKNLTPTPLIQWNDPLFAGKHLKVFIKQDYLNHPLIQGNKLWKLYGPLKDFAQSAQKEIVSFGGAYSNHLLALSNASEALKIPFTAVIRGEKPPQEGFTLRAIRSNSFSNLVFLKRSVYQEITQARDRTLLPSSLQKAYVIWEGGSMENALQGFSILADQLLEDRKGQEMGELWIPAGTGGTVAGLRMHLPAGCKIIAVPVLKHDQIDKEIAFFLGKEKEHLMASVGFMKDYHFGGYAKFTNELIHFIEQFYEQHKIILDPIYNAKMFYAFYNQVKQGKIESCKSIVLLHTGGLQGLTGFQERHRLLLNLDAGDLFRVQ